MADAPPEVSLEDQQLVARLRQGDSEAFALLYRRHSPAMQRLATAISGRPAVAAR